MLIVEIGMKLDKDLEYYDSLLTANGLKCVFHTTTHDIYYTNQNLEGLTEYQMKKSCIRLRSCDDEPFEIQNKIIMYLNQDKVNKDELTSFEEKLSGYEYRKVFDTTKEDYHYSKDGMDNCVQLQLIKDIGLIVYFDNKDYYRYDLEEQRMKFDYDMLGLDKLRTLYYGREMFSENQNG